MASSMLGTATPTWWIASGDCSIRAKYLRYRSCSAWLRGSHATDLAAGDQQPLDVRGVADLRVVFGVVADDAAGIGEAPERACVVGDAVEDLERHVPLVLNPGGLDRADEQLLHVARADVRRQVALVRGGWLAFVFRGIEVARRADAHLNHPQPPPEGAASVGEPQRLVGDLGPAVVVVRFRQILGTNHLQLARVDQLLIPIGSMARAGNHDEDHSSV